MRQREVRNERTPPCLSQNDSRMKPHLIEAILIIACKRLKMHDFGAHRNASVISASSRMRLFTTYIVLVIGAQFVHMRASVEAYVCKR